MSSKMNELLDEKEDLEEEYKKINRTYISSQVAFGIGLLGFLFLVGLWPLWVFLILIGLLTWLTSHNKRNDIANRLLELKQLVRDLRDAPDTGEING